LEKSGNWDRVIAIPPVESRTSLIMKFESGQKHIKRIQLPLILAFALTVHKAKGRTKEYVLFVASSKLFARALAYVALSRCVSLEGLYIIGGKITTRHFKQTFGNEDIVIKSRDNEIKNIYSKAILCAKAT
jgi:ATP-dependent exoDNAse (exonuclease V) alpha subunit